jgi:hypothetical protein
MVHDRALAVPLYQIFRMYPQNLNLALATKISIAGRDCCYLDDAG